MKTEYRATLTVNVYLVAENEDEAHAMLEDMEYTFINPNDHDELPSEIIEWELTEVAEIDVDDIEEE